MVQTLLNRHFRRFLFGVLVAGLLGLVRFQPAAARGTTISLTEAMLSLQSFKHSTFSVLAQNNWTQPEFDSDNMALTPTPLPLGEGLESAVFPLLLPLPEGKGGREGEDIKLTLTQPWDKQGNTILLNGHQFSVPWLQWRDRTGAEAVRTGIADTGLMQLLGVDLLSSHNPDQQPVAWFSEADSRLPSLAVRRQGQFRYLDVTDLLHQQAGWQLQAAGNVLKISSPVASIGTVRDGKHAWGRRIVLTLDRPAPWQVVQRQGTVEIGVDARLPPAVQDAAKTEAKPSELVLRAAGDRTLVQTSLPEGWRPRVWSLPDPHRVIIDLRPDALVERDILWAPGLRWRQQVLNLGAAKFPVVWLEVDPHQPGLQLKPMWSNPQQQPGIAPLSQTAQRWQAVAAINGGFFNRNNQLPLGAMRRDGIWQSGPILNRGAIAWDNSGNVKLSRLSLQETLTTDAGQRFPILLLNSGYVKAGIARYTTAWGKSYTALTDYEIVVTVRRDRVIQQARSTKVPDPTRFPIPTDGYLLVFRSYKTAAAALPPGTQIRIASRTNPADVNRYPHILAAGPLLLQNRRIVLNPRAEQFSPAFSQQAASRSAIGKTAAGTLVIAAFHNRQGGKGPTLKETAQLMQKLGAIDALNLDGGGSTSLYLGGQLLDRPASEAARVHNGLGIFLETQN